jgi:hypothetical protein
MIRTYLSRAQMNADRLAALLVTLAPLIYFFPALRGQIIISPDDGVIFNIPLRVAAANLMRAGHLPLWDPYIFSGMPLHGAAQAGVLFPINWYYLIFSPPVATNMMMLATYMVAALGAYLYARRSGANITGAIATSFIWQFSAFLVEQVGHTNVLQTAAMLPWVLWAAEAHVATGSRRRGLLLAGLVALQVFAGHQQTSAYALLLTAAYTLVLLRASKRSLSAYLSPLAMLALGFLLAAVQILPTIELLRNSMRATASYDFFSSFSMPPRFALTMFAPYLFGGGNGLMFRAPYVGPTFFGEYVAYVGLLTIMLAGLAILFKPDIRTKFWAIVFAICLLLAFGRFLPLHMYAVIYYVPVLNLFRVPARHLMEVEFALAVLAGRGITIIAAARSQTNVVGRRTLTVAVVGAGVFLLTCLTVTWWRPTDFHLGRQAPLSFLRAPELFVPVLMAALSAVALWAFSRSSRRRTSFCLLAVLLADLFVYGQGSGWRTSSPGSDSELWSEPAAVKFLRGREGNKEGSYRLLTADQRFDPAQPVPPPSAPGDWMLSLQPDVYMMHGIENAAGYDGFGLARYSRLAGDMKVWGELTDPERTLRGDSREIDLLNVRYLLTRPFARVSVNNSQPSASAADSAKPPSSETKSPAAPADFPAASKDFAGNKFAADDLNLSHIDGASKLVFSVPPVEVDRLALITKLSWSVNIPDGAVVARIKLFTESGKSFNLDLRVGEHTAEWAYDRADIQTQIKHRRPPVATSYRVDDGKESYQANSYVASLALPERATVKGGEIIIAPQRLAPDLLLDVLRISLFDQAANKYFPLRREWFSRELTKSAATAIAARERTTTRTTDPGSGKTATGAARKGGINAGEQAAIVPEKKERWRQVSQIGNVAIFENLRALPRAWLATEALVLKESAILEVIRTARLPDGKTWEPSRLVLIEDSTEFKSNAGDGSARVEVTSHEPNRIAMKTKSSVPTVLVLSENHYPGWRAYVDGRAVETLRVNYNLRGVTLAAGEHDVEFLYRPKSVLFGLAISLLTLLGLLLWWRRLLPGFVRVGW